MITGEWGDIRIFAVQGKMSKWISGEDFMTYMYGKFVPNAKANSREPPVCHNSTSITTFKIIPKVSALNQ